MTLLGIYKRYRWKISLTLLLVLLEAIAMLLLPLVIGFAIDGLVVGSYTGVYQLAGVGFGILVSGSVRRLYDTRVYSSIYVDLSSETVEKDTKSTTSMLTARMNMLKELVEFFENSFPELIVSLIGLLGTIAILYSLNFKIFLGCLFVLFLIVIVFAFTSKRTTTLNYHYNNTLENQVVALDNRNTKSIRTFMMKLMQWNIKLSDLETIIFGIIWLGMTALIVFSVVEAAKDGTLKAGAIMSIVMYVFQFAEGSGMLPLYYQQYLRLNEISERLKSGEET